jgi:FlaG/FlaF family flagellin (archaellin)
MRRSNKAASEVLAVTVLAIAAIVLAAVVWIFLLGSTQTQTAAPDFVFDASLISMNPGSCRLSVTVKNTGSVPLDRVDVSVDNRPALTITSPLPPGRSASSAGNVACSSPGSNVVIELEAQSGQNRIRKAARVVVQ